MSHPRSSVQLKPSPCNGDKLGALFSLLLFAGGQCWGCRILPWAQPGLVPLPPAPVPRSGHSRAGPERRTDSSWASARAEVQGAGCRFVRAAELTDGPAG